MPDISKLTIIFVHGLASKPPIADLHRLWMKAFIENIRIDSTDLADQLEQNPNIFHSAYWANAIPDHIEDTSEYVTKLSLAVDEIINIRKTQGSALHISKKGWLAANTKKFGLTLVNLLSRSLTIKDNVIEEYLREIRLYKNDQFIAEQIRKPLEEALTTAWEKNHKTVIISHSMGTLIAYDVLWKFSHRSESKYTEYKDKKVDYLITMGSPLGDQQIKNSMLIERWKNSENSNQAEERNRLYPLNIKQWHNYSAMGDIVCHDSTLEDDFFNGMENNITHCNPGDLKDFVKLYNPFETPTGKKNPHKSYGYLIQPKLSQQFIKFMNKP